MKEEREEERDTTVLSPVGLVQKAQDRERRLPFPFVILQEVAKAVVRKTTAMPVRKYCSFLPHSPQRKRGGRVLTTWTSQMVLGASHCCFLQKSHGKYFFHRDCLVIFFPSSYSGGTLTAQTNPQATCPNQALLCTCHKAHACQ